MRKTDGILKLVGLCLLAGALLAGLMFPVVGGLGVMSNQASATVENTSTELAQVPPALVTTITDRKGKQIATLYRQYRIPTATDQISDAMKWALISVEDRRFYEHNGVDWKGTIRAAISNTTGGDTQGASTLTQQYVKNYLINVVYGGDEPRDKIGRQKAQEQSLARKLKEARIAIQLETKMSKEDILTGYLNVVEFSRQIFGVGAAARAYFDVDASELDAAQSALLAAMVNNPSALDPWNYPERAKQRRNAVIDRMVTNRKLSADAAEEIKKQSLGVVKGGPNKPAANCVGAGPDHGFFCQYVEDYLIQAGMDRTDLYSGGYTVKTTLDREINKHAKESAERQVKKNQDNVANTLSLVKPGKKSREVVALAANRDYGPDSEKGQIEWSLPAGIYNQNGAGSVYKIFTAAAALDQGVAGIYDRVQSPNSYTSRVFFGSDNPRCPIMQGNTRWYCLSNAGNTPNSMSLQDALAKSPNTTFVMLAEKAGMDNITAMASKLGMRKTMASNGVGRKPDPDSDNAQLNRSQQELYGPSGNNPGIGAFTLGVSPLSGLELANVGATIMSGGVWCPPTPIREVLDRDGNEVEIESEDCEQAVDEELANTLAVGMSKDHLPGATGHGAASRANWGDRPMIGKTGTSQNNRSAAFVGATPQLAGAAMTFRPDHPNAPGGICTGGIGNVYNCGSGNIWGGTVAADTWFGAMSKILEGEEEKPLPKASSKYERFTSSGSSGDDETSTSSDDDGDDENGSDDEDDD